MREYGYGFETKKEERRIEVGQVVVSRKELGSEIRKQFAIAAKLAEPQHGLFLVSEGVGTEEGAAVAAREIARVVSEELGEKLDRMIENNDAVADSAEKRQKRIGALVRVKMIDVFTQALDTVKLRGVLSKPLADSGIKSTVAKLVEMSDGTKRLFLAHVGDVRAYLFRDGRLFALTMDQTMLRHQLDRKKITEKEFDQIDQAIEPDKLSENHRAMFALRSGASAMNGEESVVPEVQEYAVREGDRIAILNAGVHFNLLKSEIAEILNCGNTDAQTEFSLQEVADNEAGRKSPRGRSIAADLSAVVYTIEEHSGEREYLHLEKIAKSALSFDEEIERLLTGLKPL